MVTYSDLFAYTLALIGLAGLFIAAWNIKKYPPGLPKPAVTSFEVITLGG